MMGICEFVVLKSMSEIVFMLEFIVRFCTKYRELFGIVSSDDMFYELVFYGWKFLG